MKNLVLIVLRVFMLTIIFTLLLAISANVTNSGELAQRMTPAMEFYSRRCCCGCQIEI